MPFFHMLCVGHACPVQISVLTQDYHYCTVAGTVCGRLKGMWVSHLAQAFECCVCQCKFCNHQSAQLRWDCDPITVKL